VRHSLIPIPYFVGIVSGKPVAITIDALCDFISVSYLVVIKVNPNYCACTQFPSKCKGFTPVATAEVQDALCTWQDLSEPIKLREVSIIKVPISEVAPDLTQALQLLRLKIGDIVRWYQGGR
jgi:hypothetical protein